MWPQHCINITFICTRKPPNACGLLYYDTCFIEVIWNQTYDILKACLYSKKQSKKDEYIYGGDMSEEWSLGLSLDAKDTLLLYVRSATATRTHLQSIFRIQGVRKQRAHTHTFSDREMTRLRQSPPTLMTLLYRWQSNFPTHFVLSVESGHQKTAADRRNHERNN